MIRQCRYCKSTLCLQQIRNKHKFYMCPGCGKMFAFKRTVEQGHSRIGVKSNFAKRLNGGIVW